MIRLVTCPESAHLEEIDYDVDPCDGDILRIARCSAFTPACRVACSKLCQARLNKKNALRRKDRT